ncbi:50S ribosomal protein L5 [Candidatus Pacearchaeota archaeon CG10_big_fil_rev_8_21_14_0_10_32_14]|nr:MAG: 50S ribosomal protein L5 [Candidatus Pacearchaeota archaeon CG10_big_fil_rev_8_21_14_0_10_32_14]
MAERIKNKTENEPVSEKTSEKKENNMRKIAIEKVVLSVGGVAGELEKGVLLLKIIGENQKVSKTQSTKRIPSLGVRPGLEIGAVITIRKDMDKMLKRLLSSVNNKLSRKQISTNNFSFGIHEYIEILGIEYQREIGIKGLDVTVVFKRSGRRVRLRKIKRGKIPLRQVITRKEIIKFMEDNFGTEFHGKVKD